MTFEDAVGYLYTRLPVFHNIGARAYQPGLQTTIALCEALGNPQLKYPTVHVAGTNGKGSTSHMLAAVLQQAGYKTGLYTSPHLKSFTERIKVDGQPASEQFVADFVAANRTLIESINPSFFEVTVAMALYYFALAEVDIAVIEVGMGGRLDSTNIITPVLSVITNISWDHVKQLGNSLPKIAFEKAGIIKTGVPVVISERQEQDVMAVFEQRALQQQAPLTVAADEWLIPSDALVNGLYELEVVKLNDVNKSNTIKLSLDLCGSYQKKNIAGVLSAIEVLRASGWEISRHVTGEALRQVTALTGFKGRWTLLQADPLVVCDTAHNVAGLTAVIRQFLSLPAQQRHFVLGFVNDKDISGILPLFPRDARYYFCQPSNARALAASELQQQARSYGLRGSVHPDANNALEAALKEANRLDTIYVGGSTFVVADLDRLR